MTAYETLPGRSKENARAALDKAVKNGFAEEDVLTTRTGYLIPTNEEPEPVEEEAESEEKSEEKSESETKPARRTRAKTKEE